MVFVAVALVKCGTFTYYLGYLIDWAWLPDVLIIKIVLCIIFHSHSDADVDVTGISEFSVNDSIYQVMNDSVIIVRPDSDKYQDSDVSDSDSSDAAEITGR